MASLHHQQNEIYFVRILLERCLQLLRIPRKFTSKYGFNLSNPVFLKPPDGTEWKIFWTKSDDDIWFQNGWKEFVRYYSLEKGHLVMFKYEETSRFDVLLFDKTTLQIEYPSHVLYDEKPNLDDQFSDDSVEILDEKPPDLKAKLKSPLSSPRPRKKLKVGTNGDFERRSSLKSVHFHDQTEGRQSQGTKLEKSIHGNAHVNSTKKELEEDMEGNVFTNKKCPNSEQKARMETLTPTEKTEALKRANTFRSENPFFILIIQPSYVSNKSSLHIPSKFADEHIEKKQGTVILEVLEGRTWSAIYNGHKILSGWYKFARDNNLKVGDACVFEMTNSIELSFKVLIYRAPEDPSCSFSQGLSQNHKGRRDLPTSGKSLKPMVPRRTQNTVKNEALENAMSSKFRNPFFKVVMQKSYASGRANLRVPLEFAKKYFNVEKNIMLVTLRRVDGRLWSVRYKSRFSQGKHCPEFSHGWKQFVVDNDFQIGDVCVFELVHRIKLTFDITIFRDTKDGTHSMYSAQGSKADLAEPERNPDIETTNVCTSKVKSENPNLCDQFRAQVKFSGKSTERTSTSLLKHGATRVLEKAEKFESDNPFFTVCIRPCHMQRSKPHVPKAFYMRCTTEREKNMLIQVGERSWHVKLICPSSVSSAHLSPQFSAGWPAFARENNLQGGDVCIFELINREDTVLEAHIFRCHS